MSLLVEGASRTGRRGFPRLRASGNHRPVSHGAWILWLGIAGLLVLPCQSRADWCGTLGGLCFPPSETPVWGLTVYNGTLIAVGEFYSIPPDNASYVAQWNGASWEPLGLGVSGSASAATSYAGQLIVGGYFGYAGGRPANSIARWNGTWWPLGSGIVGFVDTLLPFGSNLIVGGGFHTAGGYAANYIAEWNGATWASMSSGTNGEVDALVDYNGALVAGGGFTQAGGTPVNNIALWDGTAWKPLGVGVGDWESMVYTLAVYNGDLIAGGHFTQAGGKPASHIARWDGMSWYPLGSGLNADAVVLTIYDGDLIAGGDFTTAGGDSAYAVARWDGTSWSAMGSGLHNDDPDYPGPTSALAFAAYDSGLVAGGNFINPGFPEGGCVALWSDPPVGACCHPDGSCTVTPPAGCPGPSRWQGSCTTCDPNPCPTSSLETGGVARFLRPEPEPNPSAGPVLIRYGLPSVCHVVLDIFDVSGQQIRHAVNEREAAGLHSISWDSCNDAGTPVPSGIYMIRLKADSGVLTGAVTLIR